jgi:hypothetical protein
VGTINFRFEGRSIIFGKFCEFLPFLLFLLSKPLIEIAFDIGRFVDLRFERGSVGYFEDFLPLLLDNLSLNNESVIRYAFLQPRHPSLVDLSTSALTVLKFFLHVTR